ncbi:MAG: sodium-dependent transporter [Alistipes sp.]|nr:sodium-dependent transporter [Alistipes sp.]
MAQETTKRGGFGGKLAAILAAAGSAIGLGNIWRFPYITSEHGGGAFIIIYLGCILLLGLPLLIAEFSVGHNSKCNPIDAFSKIRKGWGWLGAMGLISVTLIMGYYFVISGWTLNYAVASVTDSIGGDYHTYFTEFTSGTWAPLLFTYLFILANHFIIVGGVQGGIEKASKVMMPLLFVILLLLAVYSIWLPEGREALGNVFTPDFSKVTGKTFLDAMGQAFFTLSIGMGAMLIYGSYFKKGTKLAGTAISVVSLDTIVAITAAVIIFAANPVNAEGKMASGPSLAFEAMPQVFSVMPAGNIWATLFFLLLGLAALSSTISMHEAVTSYFVEKRGMSRKAGAWFVTFIAMALATVCSLSWGVWSGFTVLDMNIFSLLDNFTAIIMLPLLGILTAVFVGWVWRKEDMRAELTAEGGVDKATYPIIRFLLRYVCPVLVSVVFVFGIIDFAKSVSGASEPKSVEQEVVEPQKELRLNMSNKTRQQFEQAKMQKPMLGEKMLKLKVQNENSNNETK